MVRSPPPERTRRDPIAVMNAVYGGRVSVVRSSRHFSYLFHQKIVPDDVLPPGAEVRTFWCGRIFTEPTDTKFISGRKGRP